MMPITVADLKFYQSERMTDTDDGGGRQTATEIVSGNENQIFDDISDVDRAAGDFSIRKIFAAVTSDDTSKYLDACVALMRAPTDANVSVLISETADHYNERAAIAAHIEQYFVRANRYPGIDLYEQQTAGSRNLLLVMNTDITPPPVNTTMEIVEYTSTAQTVEKYSQVIRISRVLDNTISWFETNQYGRYQKRVVTVELTDSLRETYHGGPVQKFYGGLSQALLFKTSVSDTFKYHGIAPMTAAASIGSRSVTVDGIYRALIPSNRTETPLIDLNAASSLTQFKKSGDTVSITVSETLRENSSVYLGGAVMPGSITITAGAQTLTDNKSGDLLQGTTAVATINYSRGIILFTPGALALSGDKTVSFTPAAATIAPALSTGIPITEANRALTYVLTLSPIPAPNSLVAEYMSAGNWYRLTTKNTRLAGESELYGSGTLNTETGTVSLSLGALPDINSTIILMYAVE